MIATNADLAKHYQWCVAQGFMDIHQAWLAYAARMKIEKIFVPLV